MNKETEKAAILTSILEELDTWLDKKAPSKMATGMKRNL
jgi:inhibitor of KinA sporulation pathway (predicted exonuclease)